MIRAWWHRLRGHEVVRHWHRQSASVTVIWFTCECGETWGGKVWTA